MSENNTEYIGKIFIQKQQYIILINVQFSDKINKNK